METNPDASANIKTDELATFGQRFVAGLIDGLLAGLLSVILGNFGTLIGFIYFVTRDALPFLDGQSIGKRVMNIRAITEEGEPLTNQWVPSLIRSVVLYIPLFVLVELWFLYSHPQLQRLGDQWAKTKVVVSEPNEV